MKHERKALRIYLKHFNFDELSDTKNQEKVFLKYCKLEFQNHSEGMCKRIYSFLMSNYSNDAFNILNAVANDYLIIKKNAEGNNEICVKDKKDFKWRDISNSISADILICSFLSKKENRDKLMECNWPLCIRGENSFLMANGLGYSDNHFHIAGTFGGFEHTWAAIMNHYSMMRSALVDFDKNEAVQDRLSYSKDGSQGKPVSELLFLAAVYRAIIFSVCCGYSECAKRFDDFLKEYTKGWTRDRAKFFSQLSIMQSQLAEDINCKESYILDYAYLDKDIYDDSIEIGERLLRGERNLLRKAMSKNCNREYLLQYISIKLTFRDELLYQNDKTGLDNFHRYESSNIQANNIINKLSPGLNNAYKSSLSQYGISKVFEDEKLDFLDIRAGYNMIRTNFETWTEKAVANKLSMTVSLKRDSRVRSEISKGNIRAQKVRREANRDVDNTLSFIKLNSTKADLINGIDTCGSELDCRPEVFAPEYRRLKSTMTESKFGFTYHVAEDFMDIVDGLRAIDELIVFCNFDNGDRIGHGVALGIDVAEFYKKFDCNMMLSKQMLLDNIVWMLARIKPLTDFDEARYKEEITRLNAICEQLYIDIYVKSEEQFLPNLEQFDDEIYFKSWLIRGEFPELIWCSSERSKILEFEKPYLANNDIEALVAKKDKNALVLCENYYSGVKTNKIGSDYIEFVVTDDFIELVRLAQQYMLHKVKRLEISVETNPTSNLLITSIDEYKDHPIYRMKDEGVKVSINTDDPGIINTTIFNELQLMYKAYPGNGNVDDWIKEVIEEGNLQRFRK